MRHTSITRFLPLRCLLFAILVIAQTGAVAASPTRSLATSACSISDESIEYNERSAFFSSAIEVYDVIVDKLPNITEASKPVIMDFPEKNSTLQIFYYKLHGHRAEIDGPMLLVGCVHAPKYDEKAPFWFRIFVNGNNGIPIIDEIFSTTLKKNIGHVLLMVVHWPTHSYDFSGRIYQVSAYKVDTSNPAKLELLELGHLENEIDGENTSILDGVLNEKRVVYPYKTRADVMRRLEELGYLDK